MAKSKPIFAGKILSVTFIEAGTYSVVLQQGDEVGEYILRDSDPHGIAPYLRGVIDTMVGLGQLKILTGE